MSAEAEFHQMKVQILDWLSQYQHQLDVAKFNKLLVALCGAKLHQVKMALILDSEYQAVHRASVQQKREYIRRKIQKELGLDLTKIDQTQVDRFYRYYERFLELCN